MRKKKKNNQMNDVIKALHRAERELQFEKNGYDHPWVSITVAHKNKKAYNRKRDRKNFDYSSDGLFHFISIHIHQEYNANYTLTRFYSIYL